MTKPVRISLANKCQLLFGAAVVLILTAALTVTWQRMQSLIHTGLEETAHKLADAYLSRMISINPSRLALDKSISQDWAVQGINLTLITKEDFESASQADPFLAKAIARFESHGDRNEHHSSAVDQQNQRYHQFARAIRKSDRHRLGAVYEPTVDATEVANPLEQVLLIQLRADPIARQQTLNRIYVVAAGLLAGLLAIGVFWFITMRIILSPVRVLRDTAKKVTEGDLNIRSDINTGDEFEQLSEAFNHMLETINVHQEDLKKVNQSLDLKLGELAERNVALYEADKIKGEFLANVSHELRTPLNSIIGFAEVLQETLKSRTGPVDEKRKRYIGNIISSSHKLLELITDLLDLAKIEAGRIELRITPVSIADAIEGPTNLIRPQTEKRGITLEAQVEADIPVVQTDESKLQQILFNFLSNAVKFTPDAGRIEVRARLNPALHDGQDPQVCISVLDSGPGIAPQDHEKIFEKFTQLESTETRQYSGTGLGLTISRDLAHLLQGTVELDSDIGRGAIFSLIVPLEPQPETTPLMPDDVAREKRGAEPGSLRQY